MFHRNYSVHREFNRIARKLGVFVVEASGDTFVFIAGIGPDPRPDHALVVVNFARKCTKALQKLTKVLESSLGPDTTDLALQIGIASGPVTGGTLRSDKSRYQVFGTTVKIANVLVATGSCGMIQVSQETADLLHEAGCEDWTVPRPDKIGHLSTFWITFDNSDNDRTRFGGSEGSDWGDATLDDDDTQRLERLIRWNVGQLEDLLKKVV